MTGTAFGPQGRNAVDTLPSGTTSNRYGAVDTWFQDCQNTVSPDGTVANAQWYNMVTGNLRNVVQQANAAGAAITLTDGDMTLLYQAIQALIAGGSVVSVDTSQGLTLNNGQVGLDFTILDTFI